MLIGQYQTIVGKGRRIAIPSEFRKELGGTFVITKWYEKCLVLVSKSKWEFLLSKLSSESGHLIASVRDTERFILGSAFEIEPDKQGRVVVSPLLAEYAKITNEAIFVGLGNRVEIWDKEEWIKREQYIAVHAARFLEEIAKDA